MSEHAQQIRDAVGRAVVGQRDVIEQVIVAFLAGGHVLLEGAPGMGKTLLVLAMARAIGGRFARIQFTPDLMPADVTGHTLFDPNTGKFTVRRGPVFCNLLLADEINRAPAKTQAALLEVMAEQQVTIEGTSFTLKPPFMALATQNPIEQEGTYPLPEAQLDRFLLKVIMDYPSAVEEAEIVSAVTAGRTGARLDASATEQVVDVEGAAALQQEVAAVRVEPRVIDYAVRLVRATRETSGVAVGAGPRGAIALVRAGRARAWLQGRDFMTPDDVKALARPALRHRILLAPELEIEGLRPDDVLARLLESVDAPRQ
ncbi:MAG: MoxR-like ATPase [Myxococcota bacterium]|jgi:MoxR-like ATPase